MDTEAPRNLLKFRVSCDYTDGGDSLVNRRKYHDCILASVPAIFMALILLMDVGAISRLFKRGTRPTPISMLLSSIIRP